ncbi:hypothetical protein QFW77_17885 [Luteimonas sp. RD2P54]|uniref:Protochlamydia outer membrane protein domain-containing protein n=1 Tax=Luteimonas endophytica TaxID=3042023 RepID=A0ABT6JF78_9GAMM|nr:hypothetical protein [Luteimonas endophytica]MDH5824843.1 hypothetical protein [Luteimonas endophytica]
MTRIPRLACGLCVAGSLFALPAHAQQQDDHRFALRLSGFNPEASLAFSAEGAITDGTDTATFDDSASFDIGREWRPRGSAWFRISPRQRLIGNFYDYRRGESWSFDGGTLAPDGIPGEAEIPAVDADARFEFALANLNYEFAVVDTPAFQWGVGLGVTHARLETRLRGTSTGTDELDPESVDVRWKRSEWTPGVHTRLAWSPNEKWQVSLEGQYLDAQWGDFLEEDGHFERGGLLVEYMVTERVGVHVGYDWFRLKMADGFSGSVDAGDAGDPVGIERLEYDGTLTGRLKVHGPLAGVSVRF